MRKILAITLAVALTLATLPGVALAGDSHAVSNRWAGAAIGVAAAVFGGLVLNALQTPPAAPSVMYAPPPVVYSPPPVVYSPPPVVYAPPPVVYYAPPVVYTPAPVVVHRVWGPPGHWNWGGYDHRRGWDRD